MTTKVPDNTPDDNAPDDNTPESPSRLLSMVRAIAISPADAADIASKYGHQARRDHPKESEADRQDRVAKKIVKRYAALSATVGGASGLAGVVPGIGTAIAIGGAVADAAISIKFQVDMVMCLAATYGYDLNSADAQNLAMLIAISGSLEKAGVAAGGQFATKAGVRLLRTYLRGAVLQLLKELFKKFGIIFTRKALEKAIPFGIGVALGAGLNYGLTLYVGNQAIQLFRLDREDGGPAVTLGGG